MGRMMIALVGWAKALDSRCTARGEHRRRDRMGARKQPPGRLLHVVIPSSYYSIPVFVMLRGCSEGLPGYNIIHYT